MKRIWLNNILPEIGGKIIKGNDNLPIDNVKRRIPSTNCKQNTLYFDLYDKEPAVQEISNNALPLAIVTENKTKFNNCQNEITIIYVENIKQSYYKFIQYYRNLFDLPVIGITGTCGKTTTKEMIDFILSQRYKVVSTKQSQNGIHKNLNYLLQIDDKTDVGIFEMGVKYPKNLITSGRYFKPTIGIITTIGIAHLSTCGSLENYIKAKSRMLEALNSKGTLILNGDDNNIKKIDLNEYKGKIIYFGFKDKCHFQATDIEYEEDGMTFKLKHNSKNYQAYIPGFGEHNIYNALAAIIAAKQVDVSIKEAIDILANFSHIKRHLQTEPGIKDSIIIDDTWSANITSANAALNVLNNLDETKKKILVLGKFIGLGKYKTEYYQVLGEEIAESKVSDLIIANFDTLDVGKYAISAGLQPEKLTFINKIEELYSTIEDMLNDEAIVLFKTAMHDHSLDNIINKLIINN